MKATEAPLGMIPNGCSGVGPPRLTLAPRMAESGATAPSRRIPVKDRTPPYSADPWGASGNAPGSGTAELTKLEIRPV